MDMGINKHIDNKHIDSNSADQAAEWLTLLMSDDVTEQDIQNWKQWREENTAHEYAWQHLETVIGRMKMLAPKAAYQTLSPFENNENISTDRRKALKLLGLGGIICAMGAFTSQSLTFRQFTADYRTSTGQQKSFTLEDGTQITLNTASAIEIDFTPEYRLLRLIAGEVLIVTGHSTNESVHYRPFIVQTSEGRIRALGTRFMVHQREDHTHVAVLENAVEITPDESGTNVQKLNAGEHIKFTRQQIMAPQIIDSRVTAWSRGQIHADNVSLQDFLADLNRYHTGIIRCDSAVANLRISGVFPLQDIDLILSTLTQVLPVKLTKRTNYWITLEAVK